MKRLYIFDMDGLLFDTERLYQKCWSLVIQEENVPLTDEDLKQIIGMGFNQLKRYWSELLGSEDAFFSLREKREIHFWKEIEEQGVPIKHGVKEFLKYLRENEVQTALITSTPEERARKILGLSELGHEFDYVLFGDMVKHTKPDPEIYTLMAKLTTIPKEEWIIFEDSYNGVKAANNAGVDVIWIRDLMDISDTDAKYLNALSSLEEMMEN